MKKKKNKPTPLRLSATIIIIYYRNTIGRAVEMCIIMLFIAIIITTVVGSTVFVDRILS